MYAIQNSQQKARSGTVSRGWALGALLSHHQMVFPTLRYLISINGCFTCLFWFVKINQNPFRINTIYHAVMPVFFLLLSGQFSNLSRFEMTHALKQGGAYFHFWYEILMLESASPLSLALMRMMRNDGGIIISSTTNPGIGKIKLGSWS